MARLIASGMTDSLGRQVVVENQAGSAAIPVQTAARAAADGYTVLFSGAGLWTAPLLEKMPYDPVTDLAPIALLARAPNILVVHPSLPVKSVQSLIALAKARPAQLNVATGITGSSFHLAAELFKYMAGVDIVRIPYKGPAPALIALLGGQVELAFPAAGAATPYIKSGKLRALAVTSAQPYALTPELPTVASSGVPGYESATMYGMFAPAKTPSALILRLNREAVGAVSRTDIKEKFLAVGVEPVGSSPEVFAAAVKSELAVLAKVIKAAGIRAD